MHLAHAVPIIIACPFSAARCVADHRMGPPRCAQPAICLPLVCVDRGIRPGVRFNEGLQGGTIAVAAHLQADLAACAPDHAGNRHPIRVP
jgi:hypothetical protein